MASVDRWKGNRWRARYERRTGRAEARCSIARSMPSGTSWRWSTESCRAPTSTCKRGEGHGGGVLIDVEACESGREPTRRQAASDYRNHIEPSLGRLPLNGLRRGDFEAWAARLPVAPRTARQVTQYVSSMLDAAVADGLLPANPARGAKRPKVDAQPVSPFTDDESLSLRAASAEWFAVACWTSGSARDVHQAEAAGLTVDRIDFFATPTDRRSAARIARGWDRHVRATEDPVARIERCHWQTSSLTHWLVTSRRTARVGMGLVLHRGGEPANRHRFDLAWRQLRVRARTGGARITTRGTRT